MYEIFYAWQSEFVEVNNFLKDSLKKASDCLKDKYDIKVEIFYSPTQDLSGSPQIINQIINKVQNCDVFVGDFTPVCRLENGKQISNPNVMFEAGIATSSIGELRSLFLMEKGNGKNKIDKLSFDINHNRVSTFSINNNNFYKNLVEWIKMAIDDSIRDKYVLEFILKDILDDLVIIYNNYFRLIYLHNNDYPDGFFNINENEIFKRISNNTFNVFQVKKDDTVIINRIKKNIKEICNAERFNTTLISILIEIAEGINEFNTINKDSNYCFFEEVNLIAKKGIVLNENSTFTITDLSNFNYIKNSLHFRENSYLLSVLKMTQNGTDPESALVDIFDISSLESIKNKLPEASVEYGFGYNNTKIKEINFYPNVPFYRLNNITSTQYISSLMFRVITSINRLTNYVKYNIDDTIPGTVRKGRLIHFKKIMPQKICS